MKIFIDIGHPAHVHYFRNFYKILKYQKHEFNRLSGWNSLNSFICFRRKRIRPKPSHPICIPIFCAGRSLTAKIKPATIWSAENNKTWKYYSCDLPKKSHGENKTCKYYSCDLPHQWPWNNRKIDQRMNSMSPIRKIFEWPVLQHGFPLIWHN